MNSGRWRDYFLEHDFAGFWAKRAADKSVRVLVVLGLGFDPRCLGALDVLAHSGLGDRLGYVALRVILRPGLNDTALVPQRLSDANASELARFSSCRCEALYDVETHDTEGHNVVGRKTLTAMAQASSILASYTDVVLDISGMPRGMFFPLLAYLLRLADKKNFPNLHISVVDDASLDSKITGREYGQAEFLHTFRLQADHRLVWLPVVGASEGARLEKIHSRLRSACIEVCPVFPFPARSLRRADDIAVHHSDLLFEGFLGSPENVLLCDERTPFDVYRKILEVEDYYRVRLGAIPGIGPVTTVLSPLSSKALSLGVALAATERGLPVCHVEPGTYQVQVDSNGQLVGDSSARPIEIWLAGEPYHE